MDLMKVLKNGRWTRPSDKEAVYLEIPPGCRWGVRVTLYTNTVWVEAVDGPKCAYHRADRQLACRVPPPSLWERWRGVTWEQKILQEVERKREVARMKEAEASWG